MKNIIIGLIGITLILSSCGNNTKQSEARQKAINDSIAIVNLEKDRLHNEKIAVGKSILMTKLNNTLSDTKSNLSYQKKQLFTIKEFHLGRTKKERDGQVYSQNNKIANTDAAIKRIETEISRSQLTNSFDFQNTPKGTVEYLFSSAKSGDYSKLRHLLDPYGDFSMSAFDLLMVEMKSTKEIEKWKSNLYKARIMSEPMIQGDRSNVEVALGENSDKLTTVSLVKRLDLWYILNI